MRRSLIVCLMLVGVGLIFATSYSYAQENIPEDLEVWGERECAACHREVTRSMEDFCEVATACHHHALFAPDQTELIKGDFSQGEDARTMTFPNEGTTRPFNLADVAYVMGSGRYVQRYVYESDTGYRVLPVEWNTVQGVWQPFALAENPAVSWATDPAYDWGLSCAGCHTTGLDTEQMRWVDDSVTCEACHGAGSYHIDLVDNAPRSPSDDEIRDIREAMRVSADPQICGQCHSQGNSGEYHYPLGFLPQYTDLFANYTLVAVDDPVHWWSSGQGRSTNMMYNEWAQSGHAEALNAVRGSDAQNDTCLSCHSTDYQRNQSLLTRYANGELDGTPPLPVTLANAEFGVTCIQCHAVHTEDASVNFFLKNEPYALCTSCHTDVDPNDGWHSPIQQMYEGQTVIPEVAGVVGGHFSAENGPDCVTCHMPRVPMGGVELASHSLDIVMPNEGAAFTDTCSKCHAEQADAVSMQALMTVIQTDVEARLVAIQLTGAEPAWIASAYNFVQADPSLGVHNYQYTDALLDAIEKELGQ